MRSTLTILKAALGAIPGLPPVSLVAPGDGRSITINRTSETIDGETGAREAVVLIECRDGSAEGAEGMAEAVVAGLHDDDDASFAKGSVDITECDVADACFTRVMEYIVQWGG